MQCPTFREAVSARLDGEPLGLPAAVLDRHLASCPGCAAWAADAERVTRRARLAPAPPVPDLTAAVLAALPRQLPAARPRLADTALQFALLAVGAVQAGLAWRVLAAGGDVLSEPLHVAHEDGAWNLGVAIAFLAVGIAPRLAAGALPFLGTFALVLSAVTVGDLGAGHVTAGRAVGHLLVLAGVALVATTAWRGRRPRGTPAARRGRLRETAA
jgi:predicted anti-sigma-YlaC factor YlaD